MFLVVLHALQVTVQAMMAGLTGRALRPCPFNILAS